MIRRKSRLLLEASNHEKISRINFAVTYLCQSKCKNCNIWKKYEKYPTEKNNELSLDQIRDVFERSRLLNSLEAIALTGGEPFLRNDFVDLCIFFAQRYPHAGLAIPTNALNPELVVGKLEQIANECSVENLALSISLDGISATHDKIRGVSGAYDRVLALVALVRTRIPSLFLGLSFTISPENYFDLSDVYALSKKLHVDFSSQFAQTSESYYENTEKEFKWEDAQLDTIGATERVILNEYLEKHSFARKLALSPFEVTPYYLSHLVEFQRGRHASAKCYSGVHSFFMDPYGAVFPCINLNKKIGDVRESSFDSLWSSDRAKEIRKFIKNRGCSCVTPCETIPSLERSPRVMLWNFYTAFSRHLS
jgi:MoaA/NifB/PqqE/SkfB family radical SAM enzyme